MNFMNGVWKKEPFGQEKRDSQGKDPSTVEDPLERWRVLQTDTPHAVCTFNYMHITLHGSRRATQCGCVCASFHPHAIHDV